MGVRAGVDVDEQEQEANSLAGSPRAPQLRVRDSCRCAPLHVSYPPFLNLQTVFTIHQQIDPTPHTEPRATSNEQTVLRDEELRLY